MIAAPIILYPKTDWTPTSDTYSSDSLIQMISGNIPVVPAEVELNTFLTVQYRYRIENETGPGSFTDYSTTGITVGSTVSAVTSIPWAYNSEGIMDLGIGDTVYMEFRTAKFSSYYGEVGPILEYSAVSQLIINIVSQDDIQVSAGPVTGVKLKRYTDRIKVLAPSAGIVTSDNVDFAGCKFYLSLTAGGGDTGYVLINDVLITETDDSENEETILQDSSYTDTTDNLKVQTIKTRQVTNTYYTCTLNKSVIATLVRQGKIPNIFLSDGQTLSQDIVYYFVVDVLVFDRALNQVVESPYSIELEGKFLLYTTDYQDLPKRSRTDILFSIARDAMANNELISVVPGTVIRDLLDPVALEFEKFYVIIDFIFATLSLDTLMRFDDQDGDGISDPVSLNPRKSALMSALGITDPVNLQLLIDEQFDKIASNFNITRKLATKATGSVIFYTNITPTQSILISNGTVVSSVANVEENIDAQNFSVLGSQVMDVGNLSHYYNSTLKRYEITANIEAQIAGSAGNVPAGAITVTKTSIPTILVTNNAPTRYGTDRETNQEIANRIKIAKISYDSGTEGGYGDTAYDVPGVLQARVERAGDPLMMRDYDATTGKHIGGKVDVYLKGVRESQVVDQVAFKYEYPTDTYGNKVGEQFSIINASDFMIRTRNPKVTPSSPIVSINKIRNVTRAKDYSLQDVSITGDGDIILIAKNFHNNLIGMATMDVIEVNYLYRSSNTIALSYQPVERIVSVVSSQGAIVDTSRYTLVKTEDILQNGRSSIARDSIKLMFSESDNIPEFITISDESHNMLIGTPARLLMKGVDVSTIVVLPEGGNGTAYIKDVDYSITNGSESTHTYLNLLPNSKIRHGDTVSVSYNAAENFTVTYIHNSLIEDVQTKINKMKHACADTIVKESVRNFVDISFQVVRKAGTDVSLLKSRLQTAVANYVTQLKMGDSFTQGALISVIQGVEGVKEIKLPLIRMMKRNGSLIPLDDLGFLTFEVYQKTSGSGITSYRTTDSVLTYKTSDNGGDSNLFRGIYENNVLLTMAPSAGDVAKGLGRGYITADGKLIVTTTDGAPPQSKYYKATYYTYYPADENPVGDLDTSEIEYLDIDSASMKGVEVIDEKVIKRGL